MQKVCPHVRRNKKDMDELVFILLERQIIYFFLPLSGCIMCIMCYPVSLKESHLRIVLSKRRWADVIFAYHRTGTQMVFACFSAIQLA